MLRGPRGPDKSKHLKSLAQKNTLLSDVIVILRKSLIFNWYLAYHIPNSFCILFVGLSILLSVICEVTEGREHFAHFYNQLTLHIVGTL